ncbi:hypothetical protein [Clostridium oryzae]|uniref:Amidase domain protein n=1 Tax=Clostridium oryzae TaxID=1450648 RepID=A0A1V4IBW1_9CLOT|nr:hypothetical protein [Clostridium oryzae]OPJ57419.1 hypothetical protein CLORY_41120 [Clostridium oryzae]
MKSKISIVLVLVFMVIMLSIPAKASENVYGVIYWKGDNKYSLVTKDKEFNLIYDGTQDLQSFVGKLVNLSSTAEDDNSLHTSEVIDVTGYKKTVKTNTMQYVKVINKNNSYYYISGNNETELRGSLDLQQYVDKYCDLDTASYTYTYGSLMIDIPWMEAVSVRDGNPLQISYKQVKLSGSVKIANGKSYISVRDKQFALNFSSASAAAKYSQYNHRFVTVTGKEKYVLDLRTNVVSRAYSVYSPQYTLTSKIIKYQTVKVKGFINNELKINNKYTIDKSYDKYKGFILSVTGKMAVYSNGVKAMPSMMLKPISVKQVDTTNVRVYNYLNDLKRRNKTFSQAKAINHGSAHNACVYFSSQALRNVGVSIPKHVSFTHHFASNLLARGWKKVTSYKKLTPGSVCFTKDVNGGNGKPTHAYIFMGWVKKGDYSQAYIADNQAGEYGGKVLHIRNIAKKAKHNGNYKDAFNYAIVSPATYNYIK